MSHMIVHSVRGADVTLRAYEHPANGPTVLLLHGGPGWPCLLRPLAERLNALGYRVIRFDQRGCGGSQGARGFEVHQAVADVEAVRRAFKIDRANLMGVSWGGLLSQLYAHRFPERVASLFLISSDMGTGKLQKAREKQLFNYFLSKGGWREKLRGLAWSLVGLLPLARLKDAAWRGTIRTIWPYYNLDRTSVPALSEEDVAGMFARPFNELQRSLSEISTETLDAHPGIDSRVPVISIYGENGDIFGPVLPQVVERRYPWGTHIVMSRAGHFIFWDQPHRFDEHVRAFYERGERERLEATPQLA